MDFRKLRKRNRQGVATAIFCTLIIVVAFSMFAYVFTVADNASISIANSYAPGSLSTLNFTMFMDLQWWMPAIVGFVIILLVTVLSQRRNVNQY